MGPKEICYILSFVSENPRYLLRLEVEREMSAEEVVMNHGIGKKADVYNRVADESDHIY
jgi:hypothetical protein